MTTENVADADKPELSARILAVLREQPLNEGMTFVRMSSADSEVQGE